MKYNGDSDSQDIITHITNTLGGVDENDYTLKQRTLNVNRHLRRVWQAIFETYGGWRWDDTNQTDLPQATE